MKKYCKIFALIMALVILCSVFASCSKREEKQNNEPNTKQGMYYDRNGEEANSRQEVKYYDKDGNVFMLEIVEDYMPDYVNQQTGERYNGFECYITEDGYFFFDSNDKLKLVSGTTDTYSDSDGNKYYDISTVYWDNEGIMFHKAVK